MRVETREMIEGALLPDQPIEWKERGSLIAFASGWTFTVECEPWDGGTVNFTKTTNITGADTSPNVVVAWDAGEVDGLEVGDYKIEATAERTADAKRRKLQWRLRVVPEVA